MSIQIVIEHGQACPKVICDQCKRPIKDARLGNVLWDESDDHRAKSYTPTFMHKECDPGHESYRAWQPLDHFLVYLENNLKLTSKKRKESEHMARFFANL